MLFEFTRHRKIGELEYDLDSVEISKQIIEWWLIVMQQSAFVNSRCEICNELLFEAERVITSMLSDNMMKWLSNTNGVNDEPSFQPSNVLTSLNLAEIDDWQLERLLDA